MKRELTTVLIALAVLVLLGSCSSLSLDIGYGESTSDAKNELSSLELPPSGISGSWFSTMRFGKDKSRSGFMMFSSYDFTFNRDSNLYVFSIGPAGEFVISNKFRLLAGAGFSYLGGYYTYVREDDVTFSSTSQFIGLTGFIDARYFFSDHWFLELRGTISRNRTFSSSSDVYTPEGGSHSYETIVPRYGMRYLAMLGIGYNF